ncbi:MAG: glycoside hydrolase family 16 protein [Lysobacterales bacterium]|nr:MAG: glycoside hydrolase family 16 protein [Xanthomonadales bacterium]
MILATRSTGISHRSAPLCLVLAGLAFTAEPAFAQVLWSDEFDSGSVPDSAVWSHDLGASGWGNQELQEYTDSPDNARVENGDLVIMAREKLTGSTPTGFTSARLRTEDKLMFRYGVIEARIMVPDLRDGLWPAFWTLGNDFREVGWPACGELDILEMGWRDAVSAGLANRYVGSAAHWEYQGTHALYGRTYNAALAEPAGLDGEYHLFSMNWTPDSITTYLDGKVLWTMDIGLDSCVDCEELHQPHFIILNMAVGGTYTGLLSAAQITAPLPAEMRVDYVRIYDNGHTELSGSALDGTPPAIGPAHSGSWYQPDQSGHGFSLEFGQQFDGTPLAVAYWYTYDVAGNPIFLIGTGEPEANRVTIDFVSPVGMAYGVFDPGSVVREPGGTGVFEFADRDTATFSYTPSDFTAATWGHTAIDALPLIKLFGIPAPPAYATAER